MTGITIEPFMTAVKLESGSGIVIEVPELPISQAVAVLAFRAQPAPVHIVLVVAGIAVCGRLVLIQPSLVTTLAGRCSMLAEEGVFGVSIMIERDRFPPLLVVTFLALRPEVGSMDVVFLMTGVAVGGCLVFVERAFVASLALCLPVVALQQIRGITIMLEEQELPVPFSVTARTPNGKLPLMLVVLLMTGVAVGRSLILIQMPLMAGLALGRDMSSP